MSLRARLHTLVARLRGLVPWARGDGELDEEIRTHLEMATQDHIRAGLSPAEARRAAMREFGGVEQAKESYRDQRGIPFVEELVQDVRFALRGCAKTPAFTLAVILTLSAGIGGNTAMFTFANALLFQPLSGRANELVGVFGFQPAEKDYRAFSYPNYADLRTQADVFDGLLAHTYILAAIPAGDTARRAFAELVSHDYFQALDVALAAGRTFTADEERPGAGIPVVIVGWDRWRRSGFDPRLVGGTMRINGDDFTIVGVTPRGFTGTFALVTPDVWLPLGMFDRMAGEITRTKRTGLADRGHPALFVAGRLKPQITRTEAAARLDAIGRRLALAYPEANRDHTIALGALSRISLTDSPRTDHGPAAAAAVLMVMSGMVLLIACLNIANMMLARGAARGKEIAIRLALGGGRARVVRQLLTESLVLAAAGAALGSALAWAGMHLFAASLTGVMPSMVVRFDPRPDGLVLAVTAAAAVASTMIFGLGPALRLSRPDLVAQLKEAAATAGARRVPIRSALVVVQLALSVALLAGGALFARATFDATVTDPGFRYDGAVLASLDPGLAGYDETRGREAYRRVLERVRGLPGVAAAGLASQVPFGTTSDGRRVERSSGEPLPPVGARYTVVSADYFKSLGLSLRRGREFTSEEEAAPAAGVAIVDEALAQELFPGPDAIGQSIRLSRGTGPGLAGEEERPMQIVGLAPPLRQTVFERTTRPSLYVPAGSHYRGSMYLHLRSAAGSEREASLLAGLHQALISLDERLPVLELTTMRAFHDRALDLWLMRTGGRIFALFAALALGLAVVGIYGVKSYLVSQRTREIAVRMAVGAGAGDVVWLVLRHGVRLVAAGLAIGLPLAALVGMVLGRVLPRAGALDPLVILGAPLTLAVAALTASYIPARRATKVAPLQALRAD